MSEPSKQAPPADSAGEGLGGLVRPRGLDAIRPHVPAWTAPAARGASRGFGAATAVWRVLPDFMIIGTKKGGTTSLMNWLVDHPHVVRMFPSFSRSKSPHYFDLNSARSLSWYRSHFPTRATQRLRERRIGVRPLVGEASPYYMFHPAVAERVRRTVPEVKAIALLRNPVSRAYSHYWDRRATGFENLTTFEQAIEAEATRLTAEDSTRLLRRGEYSYEHEHHSYLSRGRYLEHLQAWRDRFPPEQLLILKAEDLYSRPQAVFEQVQNFLGLPVVPAPALPARNERKGYPSLDPETRQWLRDYYEPHNQNLYEALSRDFGW